MICSFGGDREQEAIAEEDVEWESHVRNILFCGKKEHLLDCS